MGQPERSVQSRKSSVGRVFEELKRGGPLEVVAWFCFGLGLIGASRLDGPLGQASYYVAGVGIALLAVVYGITLLARTRNRDDSGR